jgi:hypothetical protein
MLGAGRALANPRDVLPDVGRQITDVVGAVRLIVDYGAPLRCSRELTRKQYTCGQQEVRTNILMLLVKASPDKYVSLFRLRGIIKAYDGLSGDAAILSAVVGRRFRQRQRRGGRKLIEQFVTGIRTRLSHTSFRREGVSGVLGSQSPTPGQVRWRVTRICVWF